MSWAEKCAAKELSFLVEYPRSAVARECIGNAILRAITQALEKAAQVALSSTPQGSPVSYMAAEAIRALMVNP